MENNIPRLKFGIINLHPLKQDYLPLDYDGIVDRKNDMIFHDRTEFDENVAVVMSDFMILSLVDSGYKDERGFFYDTQAVKMRRFTEGQGRC